MSDFKEQLAIVRGKRQYIARAVNSLLEISNNNGADLNDISWESFLALPSWCLLDIEKIKKLQIACGSVYLQPTVKKSLDGSVLKQFRECVGESIFNYIFESIEQSESAEEPAVVLSSEESISETIESVGASVLLGTLSDLNIVKLYMPVLGKPLLVLDEKGSIRAYNIGCQAMALGETSVRVEAAEQMQVVADFSEASSL